MTRPQGLDLSPIGNCAVSALIDGDARFVWGCVPRVDGDPAFAALLGGGTEGQWAIEVEGRATTEQAYLRNTAVLRTVVTDTAGASLEIIDFCPRFERFGRMFRPVAYARMVRPLAGAPRIAVALDIAAGWGGGSADVTMGSNHLRFLAPAGTLRLTTDAPIGYIASGRSFRLERPLHFYLGPDEQFDRYLNVALPEMLAETIMEWRQWVRGLAIPYEWQDAVIRAAIGLKLCCHEASGAIVAALTTSIPEAPGSGRTWDYRYCWLRDAYYTVQALNRLGALDVLENYLGYLRNVVTRADGGHIKPLYGVELEEDLPERLVPDLPGYRGEGPVRVGNQAHEHLQNDVYGQVVLSNIQAFLDKRLFRPADAVDFAALERVGDRAFALHDAPDAGLWELRTRERVHTYSSAMCWAACDRLAIAADALALPDRAAFWRDRAAIVRARIEAEAWSSKGHFAASFGGDELDASLLQLVDLGFMAPDDPRFLATLNAVEAALRRGSHMLRYDEADDFGAPETAFNFCTFWLIEALALVGRQDEARALFEEMLALRSRAGLLSEDSDMASGEAWGNYPQTYSLVGIINCANLLSTPWRLAR
ncbi:glycoside hydrolase family 15 protein [Sandarakinorhabdus sp. DWP1-3-1]|uniref:glycoside hydrolase family 15 protein n=1 Tax=Sandarakinorhabdus sp. DWP1-3-1 TaxID=2804627 RepID=UPI003CF62FB7